MDSNDLTRDLPDFLRRRVRVLSEAVPPDGELVVYWMCTAARAHENPALEAARITAQNLRCPLLVYQGLSYRYPFASDRHHRFILEGARDVEAALAAAGIPYLFHLERPGAPPVLKLLADRASVVITENMPTPPIRRWLHRIASTTKAALWCIDTACVVSLEESTTLFKRAYTFRDALQGARLSALRTPYPEWSLGPPVAPRSLPLASLTLKNAPLDQLISSCPIDHTIPPVRDTKGGLIAAQQRWGLFQEQGLAGYHRGRNNAAKPAVSRMSAYLHYGQISPFRVAREAYERGGKGAEKYLDELLVWRELAYHWSDRIADPGAWEALPGWARETLTREATTPRHVTYPWESLARGKTNDDLWNLAQQSLLYHGELHNNLRMTWGKLIHKWTTSPQQTLRWLIDLNHRYALDGRDPCSYGGLMWCLGLFDRPFKPSQPVFGTVRTRNSAAHAKRLDVTAYAAHVRRAPPTQTVGVVGAGLAGLLCARTLHDHRYSVQVFDKGRVAGGRSSSRSSRSDVDWSFDHGAPYFECTDRRVKRLLLSWENAGVLRTWNPLLESSSSQTDQPLRFVGTPNNQALARHLTEDLTVHASTRIERIQRTDVGWEIASSSQTFGPFDILILNLPGPQLSTLYPPIENDLTLPDFEPVHAVMTRFDHPLNLKWDVAIPDHPVLGTVCRETSKPNRPHKEQWLIHSNSVWSTKNVDKPLPEIERQILDAFCRFTGIEQGPSVTQTHRWLYARPTTPLAEGAFWQASNGLGVCGDAWGGGIQGALLSGAHLAGRVMSGAQ